MEFSWYMYKITGINGECPSYLIIKLFISTESESGLSHHSGHRSWWMVGLSAIEISTSEDIFIRSACDHWAKSQALSREVKFFIHSPAFSVWETGGNREVRPKLKWSEGRNCLCKYWF